MAFTYTENLTVNADFVRFHAGDTVEDESFLSDAIITSLLAVNDTKQKATIQAIQYIITRLSQPNFRADWLQVDMKSAREGYESLLKTKYQEFGIARITATALPTYRADSRQTEAPDFSSGTGEDDGDQITIVVINP